jgi:hypothetical protein
MSNFDLLTKFQERKKEESWKKLWGELWDGAKIYLVDGPYVRGRFFVDFTEGGHGMVYEWIPNNEIWVEDMKDELDQGINLNHEIYEYTLMKYVPSQKKYDNAHESAANVEALVREAIAGNPTLKGKQKGYRNGQ